MKIAFLIPSVSNHGPNVFTLNLVRGLVRQGLMPEVFYFSNASGLNFPVPHRRIGFFDSSELLDFDIVHSTMLKADLFSALFLRKKGPVVLTGLHNFYGEDLSYLYSPYKAKIAATIWKWSFKRIGRGVVSSGEMKKYYESEVGAEMALATIPYGIDEPDFRSEVLPEHFSKVDALRSKGLFIVGSCGLLIRRKGYDTLIRAAAKLPNVAVAIVGDGPERANLSALANDLGVADRVLFFGQQPNSARYYKLFDAFAMTSRSEGFGIAMLEALALGLPLICSNLEIYKGYFDDAAVSLFEAGQVEGLAQAILVVMQEADERGKRSVDLYLRFFTLDLMARRHVELYESLLEDK